MATNRCTKCDEPLTGNPLHCPACGNAVGQPAPSAQPKKTRFSVGDTIDARYEVVDVLPSGGMGEVYKVRHLHLHDFRVIKILRADMSTGETGRKRFLREAKIAASITHPNLATLHDFSALPDGTFYMVSEFVDGVTIAEHMKAGGRFLTPHVVAIAEQVLDALAALHHRGIIHRDISPDNLMLTRTADDRTSIKVIDLGIAKAIDSEALTTAGFFIGKARYASPEQLQCESEEKIDGRTDLYSLGIVLYEMITGKDPYAGSTPAEYVIRKVTTPITWVNPPAGLQTVPEEVERFILRLLRVKRDERYSSADEALADLRSIMRLHPELTEETLSTITQSRLLEQHVASMSSEASSHPREAVDEPKRPITEEVDMRELVPPSAPATPEPPRAPIHLELEETPDYKSYAPPAPQEPLLSTPVMEATEVVPIAEIVNELKLEREAKLAREQRELEAPPFPVDEPAATPPEPIESSSAPPSSPIEEIEPPKQKVTASQQATVVVNLGEVAAPFFAASTDAAAATPKKPVTASQAETYVVPLPSAPAAPVTPPTIAEQSSDPNATVRTRAGEAAYEPLPTYVESPAGGGTTEVPLPKAAPLPVARQAKKKGRAGVWIAVILIAVAFITAGVILASVAWNHFGPTLLGKRAAITRKSAPTAVTPVPPPVVPTAPIYTNTAVTQSTDTTAVTATTTTTTTNVPPTSTVAPPTTATTATVTPAATSPAAPKPAAKKPPRKKKEPAPTAYTQTVAPVEPARPAVREGELVEPGPGVTDAAVRNKAPLRLPLRARLARARGAVRVSVLVGIDGNVEQTRILQSSGNDQVDRAAEAAAKSSTFSPATKEGVRVRIWKALEFQVGKQAGDAPLP